MTGPLFRSSFADHRAKGDVIAADVAGSEAVEILTEPARIKNVMGGKVHVTFQVRPVGTEDTSFMIFSPSDIVFVRED